MEFYRSFFFRVICLLGFELNVCCFSETWCYMEWSELDWSVFVCDV